MATDLASLAGRPLLLLSARPLRVPRVQSAYRRAIACDRRSGTALAAATYERETAPSEREVALAANHLLAQGLSRLTLQVLRPPRRRAHPAAQDGA